MIIVLFESWPTKERGRDRYLEFARQLSDELRQIDGFLWVERYASLTDDGKLMSISAWRDEDAVRAWRETRSHRRVQAEARRSIFSDYRLRVTSVVREYGMFARDQAPNVSHRTTCPTDD